MAMNALWTRGCRTWLPRDDYIVVLLADTNEWSVTEVCCNIMALLCREFCMRCG